MSNGATHMFKNGLTLLGYQNGFGPNGIRWDLNMPGHMMSKHQSTSHMVSRIMSFSFNLGSHNVLLEATYDL